MKQRIDWLDLWRSLAVLVMLGFHALWDLELFGAIPAGTMETPAAHLVRYLGGGSFILISGLLVLRGKNALRRGFLLLCLGLAVAVVTALIGLPVRCGILVLLGLSMLLCAALRPALERVRGIAMAGAWALLFAGSWAVTAHVRVSFPFLYPLGLRTAEFFSADYWPLFPWVFLYLSGAAMSGFLPEPAKTRALPPALTFPGRHSLVIYLAHQPLLYGICLLLFHASA